MDEIGLSILMWGYLEDAVLELPGDPPAEAFERFLSWTRPSDRLGQLDG